MTIELVQVGGPSGGETAKSNGAKGSGTPPPQGGGGACTDCGRWESLAQDAMRDLEDAKKAINELQAAKERCAIVMWIPAFDVRD